MFTEKNVHLQYKVQVKLQKISDVTDELNFLQFS